MHEHLNRALGELRSRMIYLWLPGRQQRMQKLYSQFVKKGSLCFDVGSHLGNRINAFRHLGGTVVAFEPQERYYRILKRRYQKDRKVIILRCGLGDAEEEKILFTSYRTPTVSSFSSRWVNSIGRKDPRFSRIQWEGRETVRIRTLDQVIMQFGVPDFCKIDVEGYETQVLKGLSQPVRALSFEYLPATMEETLGCLSRLQEINPDFRYNFSKKESMHLQLSRWVTRDELQGFLQSLPHLDPSGDIYAKVSTTA